MVKNLAQRVLALGRGNSSLFERRRPFSRWESDLECVNFFKNDNYDRYLDQKVINKSDG